MSMAWFDWWVSRTDAIATEAAAAAATATAATDAAAAAGPAASPAASPAATAAGTAAGTASKPPTTGSAAAGCCFVHAFDVASFLAGPCAHSDASNLVILIVI